MYNLLVLQLPNGSVSWRSKIQTIVAFDITKAVYLPLLTKASRKIWLKWIVGDLGLHAGLIMKLSGDNYTSLKIYKEARLTGGSKQIRITYHFIRETVRQAETKGWLVKCTTVWLVP